jgi:peroxiredoxin
LKRRISITVAFILLIPLCRNLRPQEDGRQWIHRVANTYGEFASYRFEGTIRIQIDGFSNASKSGSFVRYAKPKENKFWYQVGMTPSKCIVATDGTVTTAHLENNRQYVQKQSSDIRTVIASLFGDESSLYFGPALPEDYTTLGSHLTGARILRRENVRLKSELFECVVVEAEMVPEAALPQTSIIRTFWIDPENSIVLRDVTHSQVMSSKGKIFIDSVEEMQLSSYSINEEIADSLFQITLPRNVPLSESLDLTDYGSGLILGSPTDTMPLSDLDGHRYTFEELRGSVVLLDFWATWCAPCVKEMRSLEKIYQRHKDKGLAIFGVNRESGQLQTDFLKKKKLNYPMLVDTNGALTKRFNAVNLPTLVLIDRQGEIVDWEQGLLKDKELESLLEQLGFE